MTADTIFHIFQIIVIVFIGIPTIYAVLFGAPFVPTPMVIINQVIKKIPLKNGMKVYDLGCGDARFLTLVSKKKNITAIGYEYSPLIWLLAEIRNLIYGGRNVTIYCRNYMRYPLSDADIIFCYLLPNRMPKLLAKMKKECAAGTIVVSHAFAFPDIEPYYVIPRDRPNHLSPIYFYKL